jgi:gp16 family phage-associated protein
MNSPPAIQPPAEARRVLITRHTFRERGISVMDWARERGFSPHLVYAVLAGSRKCLRGQSYRIAQELGMK